MMKVLYTLSVIICVFLNGCTDSSVTPKKEGEENAVYQEISPEEAKKIMDSNEEYVVLDVREQEEYQSGHIPGAVLLPYTQIENKANEILPDKNMTILVYCRSGRRSKIAADALAKLGYTKVKEFGGITDWPYEVIE